MTTKTTISTTYKKMATVKANHTHLLMNQLSSVTAKLKTFKLRTSQTTTYLKVN